MGGRCSRWAPAAGARRGGRNTGRVKQNASPGRRMEDQAAALTGLRSRSSRGPRRGGGARGRRNRKRGSEGSSGLGWRRRGSQQERTDRKRGRKRGGRVCGKRTFASNASEDHPILPHKGLLFLAVLAERNIAAPCARACPRLVPSNSRERPAGRRAGGFGRRNDVGSSEERDGFYGVGDFQIRASSRT